MLGFCASQSYRSLQNSSPYIHIALDDSFDRTIGVALLEAAIVTNKHKNRQHRRYSTRQLEHQLLRVIAASTLFVEMSDHLQVPIPGPSVLGQAHQGEAGPSRPYKPTYASVGILPVTHLQPLPIRFKSLAHATCPVSLAWPPTGTLKTDDPSYTTSSPK